MSYNKVITCASFGGTGSSVITDLLKEFSNVKSFGDYEFTFAHEPNGISDLQHYIVDDFHRIKVDEGIYKFEKNIERIGSIYDKYFENRFTDLTNKYLKNMECISWKGNSYTHESRYSKFQYLIRFRLSDKLQRVTHKLIGKKNEYEFVPRFPKMDMKISCCSKEEFLINTREYTESIFNIANKNNEYDYIAFDQLVPPTNINRYLNYFNDLKVIVIDRDPRDLYILNKLFWKEGWIPTDNVHDFIKYYKILREPIKYEKDDTNRVLRLKFEDFILNYNETLKIVLEFIGINESKHVLKKQYFNPEISKKNMKLWEKYKVYKEDIIKIEKELIEYLYDYN